MLSFPVALVLTLVIPGLFFTIGLRVVRVAFSTYGKAKATRSWRAVPATIDEAGYEFKMRSVGTGSEPGGEFIGNYVPQVAYSYEVGGRTYNSRTLAVVDLSNRREAEVRELMAPFHSGEVCEAFYDPARPADAVLIKGGEADTRKGFIFGLVMLGFGMIGVGAIWALYFSGYSAVAPH